MSYSNRDAVRRKPGTPSTETSASATWSGDAPFLGVALLDSDGRLMFINDILASHHPDLSVGDCLLDYCSGALAGDRLSGAFLAHIRSRRPWYGVLSLKNGAGQFGVSLTPVVLDRPWLLITTEFEPVDTGSYNFDTLTHLPNRRDFIRKMASTVESCLSQGRKVTLMILDLDNFKAINDSFGHQFGDEVLLEMSLRLQALVRSSDQVFHLNGDEFVIVLNETAEKDIISALASRVLKQVALPLPSRHGDLKLTASVGIARLPKDGLDAEQLLRNLELALHQSKHTGGNQYTFYHNDFHVSALKRLSIERELQRALALKQFVLHFQPMIDLDSGEILGLESLVRWEHEERGLVPPMDFIPALETTGLIIPVGNMILENACHQARRLQQICGQPLFVSVNLSARQFEQPDLVQRIADILECSGLAANDLHLEITETVLMQDGEESLKILEQLKGLGVQLAIDDFGTGFSSLSYLKRFPVDTLKIDRSFVSDMMAQGSNTVIVKSVLALAHELGLNTVAEGIETQEQMEELQQRNCMLGQGYLFSRPLPMKECIKLLEGQLGDAPRVA